MENKISDLRSEYQNYFVYCILTHKLEYRLCGPKERILS